MQYNQVYNFILPKLEKDLSPLYTYHNAEHTISVISSAEHLAMAEDVMSEHDIKLLKTAALFHDTGFLVDAENHEDHSCALAKKHLPNFNYTEEDIASICALILSTKIPQNPSNKLARILCDADLFYLGTSHYTERSKKLLLEFNNLGITLDDRQWAEKQLHFLEKHTFYTQTARNECDTNKKKTIHELKSKFKTQTANNRNISAFMSDSFINIVGVLLSAFALKGFLVPNHFFDGGVTGMSLLFHEIYHINLAYVIILFNIPFVIISYFSIGQSFSLKMFGSVVLLGICLVLMPTIALTSDKLLISIFGGVFLGLGVGLIMRAGSALDGIEVLALYTLKKTSFSITEIILGINIIIFSIAAINFGIETALYSILTYFCATRTIDYVVEGIQAYSGVTIVSSLSDEIKYHLVEKLGRGITIYKGERGYLPGNFDVHTPCDLIFTVITRLELRRLKNVVHNIDPKAFIFVSAIKESSGGVLKKIVKH
ncbi:MAG: YitT family protein [Saprospiraceae bacterium]|jgi:uncharacterized membrane-anchored protein YitT (DUF2179 family)/predicted metal-dependent HD superfamily phosphohydrolase|nr:YitT family protein [Saprospiraceae bacterium]